MTDILVKSVIKDEEVRKDIESVGQILERNLKILTYFYHKIFFLNYDNIIVHLKNIQKRSIMEC